MKKIILFSMKGCPHCQEMKKLLDENGLKYDERDIHKFDKEYDLFVEATNNEYIPAFMLMTIADQTPTNIELLAPDRDFQDFDEALIKIRNYME